MTFIGSTPDMGSAPGEPWPYQFPQYFLPTPKTLDTVEEYKKYYRYFLLNKAYERIKRDLIVALEDLEKDVVENILDNIESSIEDVIRDEPWFP